MNEISELYQQTHFLQDINLIYNPIYEYDISKANISILYKYNVINHQQFKEFYHYERMKRQIAIGNMIKSNPKIGLVIKQGIVEMKKQLFLDYNIQDEDILSIKNDAVFLFKYLGESVDYDPVRFVLKNSYSLYCKVFRIEFYYDIDKVSGIDKLDIKGVGDDKIKLHENYMFDFVREVFKTYRVEGSLETIKLIRVFYYNYIHRLLDPGYYRGLDSDMYEINSSSEIYIYNSKDISSIDMKYVNINSNAAFVRELSRIFYGEYLKDK